MCDQWTTTSGAGHASLASRSMTCDVRSRVCFSCHSRSGHCFLAFQVDGQHSLCPSSPRVVTTWSSKLSKGNHLPTKICAIYLRRPLWWRTRTTRLSKHGEVRVLRQDRQPSRPVSLSADLTSSLVIPILTRKSSQLACSSVSTML